MMRASGALLASLALGSSMVALRAEMPPVDLPAKGRLIYETGMLSSGAALRAERGGGVVSIGQAAACIKCHQRSGFGLFEANNLVPPVTGPSLFHNVRPPAQTQRRAPGMSHQEFPHHTRPAYDDVTLARALREGISSRGYRFQYLMPRYDISDEDMSALIAYLRQLSSEPSPGIDKETAHFATVIASGQDRLRRQAVVDVLTACIEKRRPADHGGQRWFLHVWDLEGPPEAWLPQLKVQYAKQPVFAIVSGLGSYDWGPVHRFAENLRIPQLFPNIDIAPVSDGGTYSFYFWKGVGLEAEVIARYVRDRAIANGVKRVIQVGTGTGAGAKAAEVLRQQLEMILPVENRDLKFDAFQELSAAFADLSRTDLLVIWLRSKDVATLTRAVPPPVGQIVFSGWLSGLEQAPITLSWKRVSVMVYPVDAPRRRDARMQFNLRPWLKQNVIEYSDEILLGNTLAACNLLREGMLRLRGAFFRDYLVELTENYPTGMGNAPAAIAFPRFLAASGQRYSSRGAYIIRFAPPTWTDLELVQDWIVPE